MVVNFQYMFIQSNRNQGDACFNASNRTWAEAFSVKAKSNRHREGHLGEIKISL